MDVPTWFPWVLVYLAFGLTSAACWCMVAWKTQKLKKVLADSGYEHARYKLLEIGGLLIAFWPWMLSVTAVTTLFEHLSKVGNPHLAHREAWEAKIALRSMEEQQFPGNGTVDLTPECACQIDPHYDKDELNPYMSEYMDDSEKLPLVIKQRDALKKEIRRLRSIGLS